MRKSNERTVTRRGGSLTVTIPAGFAALLGIAHGTVLAFDTNGRELIVRVARQQDKSEQS